MLRKLNQNEMEEASGGTVIPRNLPVKETGGHCSNSSPFILLSLGSGLGYTAIPNPAHALCLAPTPTPPRTPSIDFRDPPSGGGFDGGNGRTFFVNIQDH